MNYFVHQSSYVDDGAKIGKGTKIWHFSHVMAGAEIGEDCTIGQNVFIGPNVKIGNNSNDEYASVRILRVLGVAKRSLLRGVPTQLGGDSYANI